MIISRKAKIFGYKDRCIKQLLRKKGLTTCLLVFLFFCLNILSVNSQNVPITLNQKNVTLEKLLNEIETQTDYLFVYDKSINKDRVVTVTEKDKPLKEILDNIFKETDIKYVLEGKNIILSTEKSGINKTKQTQKRTIKGSILDEFGDSVIGASVSIAGTAQGTLSDLDGNFELTVPDDQTKILISYIGMTNYDLVLDSRSHYDIVLTTSSVAMDEVVVTAMGIKRESKALTYNVQQIKMDEVTTVKGANVMGNLAGKIAGVTINQSSSGMGGSTRVVMRGAKSLFGNNDALYVLDGIPLAAAKSKQSDNFYESAAQGDSESISMINTDDIETMTVLTGAAAAALYGSQGANGVILITTKKGEVGKPQISYSNNTTFSSPFVLPEFQNTYGRKGESYSSWGSKLATPSSYNPEDFFQTGASTMNTLSVAAGSENQSMRASVGATNSRGLVPNSKYERYNFSFRSSNELVKNKLTMDVSLNYVKQKDRNPLMQGLYFNPLVAVYLFPPGDDFNRFIPYKIWNSERNFETQNWSYGDEWLEGVKQNPLWTAHKNVFDNDREKLILSGTLNYKVTDWLNVSLRGRIDRTNSTFERRLHASSHELFAHSPKGNFSEYSLNNRNIYADILVNFDKSFGDFRLVGNLGGSFNDEQSKYWGYDGPLISVVDFFHMNNVRIEEKKTEHNHTRNNAWYATAQLGYKSYAYLDVTGRLDYFSSMYGPQNDYPTVFYPSFGGTVVLSEIFGIPQAVMPLWKIRASFSQVGNPPPPYLTYEYVEVENGAISSNSAYPVNLKAEKTKAFEIGTDLRLFGDLLDLSFTYYNTNTYNQLFRYSLPPTTGYAAAYANAGKVNNHGIELSLGINKKIGPVDWNSIFTYSLNRNKIKELLGDKVQDPVSGEYIAAPEYFEVSNANNAYVMRLTEGGTMGDIYVNSFKRDKNGHVYVNPGTGKFEIDGENYIKIGEAAPKYNLSLRNNFAWKGLSLGFMIDARVGGVVVSSTQALLDQFGVSKASAIARDNGGAPMNLGKISAENYYTTVGEGKTGAALSEYTYSATNVRLRELSLGYNLPSKWFDHKLKMSVSLVARNLWMLYSKAPFDPDLTSNTGTYNQGYDYFMPPSQRNIGFGLNITF